MGRSKRARSRKQRKQPREDLKGRQLNKWSGSYRGGNDNVTMDPQESDDLIVSEDRRKSVQTAQGRGEKGITVSKEMEQLPLFRESADSPIGGAKRSKADLSASRVKALRLSRTKRRPVPSTMMMEEIADEANLQMAFMEVASNRGAPGPDRKTIEDVRERLPQLLPKLHVDLLQESFRPGLVRRVWIPKAGGKQRGLGIPNVVDRVIQQAVHRVLSPMLELKFHDGSHGFRPGRSCHTAIRAAKEHLEAGYRWVVDLDIEQFFDRVHHQRLLSRLEVMGVYDPRVIRLIGRMLKAQIVMPNGIVKASEEGTPQGGPLSPLLSNVVLDEFDRELEKRGLRFVRYADDCNVYVRSKRSGKRVMASLSRFLKKRLRLTVNQEKSAVAVPGTRHFVGFSLRRKRDGGVRIVLSRRSRERLNRKVVELTRRNWGGSLSAVIQRLNRYLRGWMGFFHIADAKRDLKIVDAHIRRRLRALVLRQKKRKAHIVNWLHRKRRVPLRKVQRDIYGRHRSLWALSITSSAHKGMSSYWFDTQKLFRLVRLWRQLNAPVIAPAQLTLALG